MWRITGLFALVVALLTVACIGAKAEPTGWYLGSVCDLSEVTCSFACIKSRASPIQIYNQVLNVGDAQIGKQADGGTYIIQGITSVTYYQGAKHCETATRKARQLWTSVRQGIRPFGDEWQFGR